MALVKLTVSAVPRPRTVTHADTKPNSYGQFPKQKGRHLLENGLVNHPVIYDSEGKNEMELRKQSEIIQQITNNLDVIQVDNEEEKEKKKEKKWTLGGFFRRRGKKDADDSSEDSGEDNKKGFLSRRKSKQNRRKLKTSANGFDVVIPQHKETHKNGEISMEQLWRGDTRPTDTNNGPVRYIHRHPEVSKTSNSLPVPKQSRRDSRSSGGSENTEGRKGRKEVMARAEAKRDMMRDESSSDEYESYHSNSSLNRMNGDSRRPRRTDRHKRLSRDEEPQSDLRMVKSDLEGSRRLPPSCRWISRTYYPDSSDHEPTKLKLTNHSGTPSPCRSPRARQKQLLHYMIMQNSYPTSTFPPGIHYQQVRNGTSGMSPTRNDYTKENQAFGNRNSAYRTNRNSEYHLPRSVSNSESSNRKTLMEYEKFLNSCGSPKEKSLSFDQNIHRASYFENEPGITKTNHEANSRRTNRSEMFINGGRGADIYTYSPQPAVKTYNGVVENRTDSTPSLHSGSFPQQPTLIVQRSPSGNSFCESSRNFHPNRSLSYQHIPTTHGQCPRADVPVPKSPKNNIYCNLPTGLDSIPSKSHLNGTPSILRYYADQNPRSRNPIHITCNPTAPEQPYLSDSQVVTKPIQTGRTASDFWKLKDQELMKQQKKLENPVKLPQTLNYPRSDRSRSNSPRLKDMAKTPKPQEIGNNDIDNKSVDSNIRKILKEEYNAAKVNKTPPEPPVRKLSKLEVLARLQKCEQLKNEESELKKNLKNETKLEHRNLDEALNELEMIYNSLRLKDDDLVERAERRDLPVFRPKNPITSVSVRDKIQNFYAEADYTKNSESNISKGHQRAVPLRRSGVPDKMADDMAFRRLNQKERTEAKKLPPQSYLRSSPSLSPVQNMSPTFRKESPLPEPDITYDDVVFRNIRHANSTLKIQDPQPPFGIPIGVIAPAPNSDYLHAIPNERFRPTFTSSKTPDVVKDDLAFRNLRKDSKTNSTLDPNIKKRAVRSLSANLYNIMQKDNPGFVPVETNNTVDFDKSCEKTQSLTDLTKGKNALEKRLKELKEEKNAKRAEFFELSQEAKKKGNLSWADLANLNGNFENGLETESSKPNFLSEDSSKKFRSPIVELSKYPAAAPSSSLQGNPFKESSLVDDDQLENLLSALAKEAENASKDLERQLGQLDTKKSLVEASEAEDKSKARAVEEFNKKFKSLDKNKRRRNLSLSNTNESKEEVRKTGSLERKKKPDKKAFPFEEVWHCKTNGTKPIARLSDVEVAKIKPERKVTKADSSPSLGSRERKRSQSFEPVTDLSQILHEQNNEFSQKETNNVFQEVYEYNCKLSSPKRRGSRGEESVEAVREPPRVSDMASDVETEFEKLHEEVDSTRETKEKDFALVDDLLADITSVDQSNTESYSSFPFPNEGGSCGRGAFEPKDGTSPGSSKGEEPPNPSHPNESSPESDKTSETSGETKINMNPKNVPTSNSSSESEQKHKESRRRESSTKPAPSHDSTTKSFKATRKKEDLRGGGTCGPFLRSYLNSQSPGNQVPSTSEFRRSSSRREGKKTDSGNGRSEEGELRGGLASPREAVVVRETKASRLRAASRTPTSDGSPSTKSSRKDEKESTRFSMSCSPTLKKDVDKSHSRKSHLNRSHTSEGVYDDVSLTGCSNVRRRRSKNSSFESSPAHTATEKPFLLCPRMGNANGSVKNPQSPVEHLSQLNSLTRSPINSCRKSANLLEKCSLKPNLVKNLSDDSDAIKSTSRRSPVNIATRAEILAASTLKMINRLDEINNKTRRIQDDPNKKSLPLNTVINSENKTDVKKVPLSNDSTAKGSSSRSRLKPEESKSPEEKKKPDAKPSILKHKPSAPSSPSGDAQKPVSILKRKSLSQDDAQSYSPPVTFSPSVLKKEIDVKRQGILKKRGSLDENEVIRRRSYSPDANYDFKSILKSQRRSSMEELTRRSSSLDSTPQGILKRKSSREEDVDDEPQGILKRKSLPCLNTHQHVKIAEKIVSGATADVGENVRPILKKKSSSEEHSASDPSLSEVPKSILKKKTSLEMEEPEDKPMKPILKTSKIPSVEEPEDGRRSRSLEERKPILKRENGHLGEGENGVVLRRASSRAERPHSSSDIDSELSAIFIKRRSLEFQPVCAINFVSELQRTNRASSNDWLRGDSFRRPLSVAEKISNLENFLEVERVERERRNSPTGTPPSDFSSEKNKEATRACSTELFPKTFAFKASTFDDERLPTNVKTPKETSSFLAAATTNCISSPRSPASRGLDLSYGKSTSDIKEDSGSDRLFQKNCFHSADSEQVGPSASSGKEDPDGKHDCLDSCGENVSSLGLKAETSTDLMNAEDLILLKKSGSVSSKKSLFKELEKASEEAEVRKTAKSSGDAATSRRYIKKSFESNSHRYHTQPVSAEDVELAVRKSKAKTADSQDEGENHEDELSTMSYRDRLKLFESSFSPTFLDPTPKKRATRHRTQPITTDEVEIAKSQRRPSTSSALSTLERQTEDEIPSEVKSVKEDANHQTITRSVEETVKPKGILKNLNLANEFKTSDSESSFEDEKRRMLKKDLDESFQNLKRALRKVEKETTSELKGILKQPSSEKKQNSSSEEDQDDEEEGGGGGGGRGKEEQEKSVKLKNLGANLAAILQRVEPVKRSSGRERDEGGKITPKCMQNPGIARILNRARNGSHIVKSQSHSSVSSAFQPPPKCIFPETAFPLHGQDETDEGPLPLSGLRRSTTQPLGHSDESTDDDMSGASIRERLARLKKSGELDWQKRKSHAANLEDELSAITSGNYLFNEHCLLKEKKEPLIPKETDELRNSSVLADRLGKLVAAKEGWKKRIKPSDAVKFSVEGKLLEKRESLSPPNVALQISPTRTPLAERKKRSPKAARFRSKQCNPSLNSMPSSPMERINNPIARSVSAPGSGKDGLLSFASSEVNGPVVTVPKNDDETFTSFFDGLSTERVLQEHLEIRDEDLDAITRMKSSQLLVQKKNIKTQKRRTTVKNPVKALAARLDLQEYTEIKTGIAERELKRMKIERAAKNSNLAIEALAGLASQEDFTAVNLKKAGEGSLASPDAPYKDLMLLQVKGRRHVQTRLVEPVARNVNAGDCFILVTPNKIFHYLGEFANVIEKSRAAEISLHIQQKGDLGCTASSVITIGENGRASKEQVKEFWALLNGKPGCEKEAGSVDEDELFESALVDTNMVYEVVNDELIPVEAYWGTIPRIEVLDPNKILVFDFGSEFYVWNGKNVNLSKRKLALKLAKELWEEGFDYTDCDICPLTAASHFGGQTSWQEIPESEKAGPVRPDWALFSKITQNMETVLFREKFLDWPDYTRVIRKGKKNESNEQVDSNGALDVKPCDAKKMLENVVPEPDLVLEGSHLGRGVRYFDEETRRCSEITTQDVTVWHVNEFEYSEVESGSAGQFHMEDSYVVRWHYVITITGRELSGQPSKHLTTGRNRYAYFFWQGHDSPINDKGAAACLTVELDKEHGPQVRVVQGFEPPAFLNLFEGKMVVHRGRRCSDTPREKLRLFICRGETESESVLFEVPCSMRQLRSLASFLLINKDTGKIVVWHGWKTLENTRKIALGVAKRLRIETREFEYKAKEITIREELEGSESQEFIRALGGDNRQLYYSLLEDKAEVKTPRLFHLTSVSGEFLFYEVASPYLTKDRTTPLPFLQNDLYSLSQPALFLLDSGFCLWLWQGWREENSESERGSSCIRFQAERRAAMSTALTYWSLKYGSSKPKAYLIWAGLEPLMFTNHFPFWTDRDDVAEINMKDGRKPGDAVPIRTELASLTQSTYPVAQLQNRPLPDGVNPTTLEDYLEPQCFPDVFGMEKEEFLSLPSWKKKKLKQEAGLF